MKADFHFNLELYSQQTEDRCNRARRLLPAELGDLDRLTSEVTPQQQVSILAKFRQSARPPNAHSHY